MSHEISPHRKHTYLVGILYLGWDGEKGEGEREEGGHCLPPCKLLFYNVRRNPVTQILSIDPNCV